MKPLTKSQFKLGLSCIQKLRHYRDRLPSTLADNDLLRLLAEGGGAVEALQRAVEPPYWIGPDGGAQVAAQSLAAVRDAAKVVCAQGASLSLYEVTVAHGDFLARIDLLHVHRDRIELVEIKSKSWTGPEDDRPLGTILTKNEGKIASAWVPYLQDLAFQHELYGRWWREHAQEIGLSADLPLVPKLLLVKTGARATAADYLGNFRTRYAAHPTGPRPEVEYSGTTANLRSTDLLIEVDATNAVQLMLRDAQSNADGFGGIGIAPAMERMAHMVRTDAWPASTHSLGAQCKRCEYRTSNPHTAGVARCWNGDVDSMPDHILKLARVTNAQVHQSIAQATPASATLTALDESDLSKRQTEQWRAARLGQDMVNPTFARNPYALLQVPTDGPVYFLDFETARYPIPYRPGGMANEMVPFQFEGHRLPRSNAPLTERVLLPGFLDLASTDPRRAIVRALRDQYAAPGPIYHWHHYERTVLQTLARSLEDDPNPEQDDPTLVACCHALTDRLIDLCSIAEKNLTLRATHGSYSIKRVLPVVWGDLSIRQSFAHGVAPHDPNSYDNPTDPYKSLPCLGADLLQSLGPEALAALGNDDGDGGAINNGGLAMVYYHYLRLFGGHDIPDIQRQFRQYCQLDSAAMVMAYDYLRRPRLSGA